MIAVLVCSVFAAAADAFQLLFGKFVDDLDARQIGGRRLALAAALDWCDDF